VAIIRFDDNEDLVDICKDNVFKAVFTKETAASRTALSRFVSAVIGRNVEIINLTANEPTIENLRDRQIRFDINCRTENGELVNVEMSLNPESFEPVRLEFHIGKLFIGQDIKGTEKSYDHLKRAYQIAILVTEKFFPDDDFFHSFEYYDPARRVSLNGRTRIHTLELSKLEAVVKKPTEEMNSQELWAVYFRYLKDNSKRAKINQIVAQEEGIAMASEVLLTISRDEIERARLMSEEKNQLDYQSGMVHAKLEGRKEGEKRGIKKGENNIINLLKSGKSPEEVIREYGSN